jgi:hypothetical protein
MTYAEQRREARDVAVVFARLVDAAEHHVADLRRVDLVAGHHFLDDLARKVVRAQRRELARVAADGAAQSVVNVGVEHAQFSGVKSETPSCARRRSQGLGR